MSASVAASGAHARNWRRTMLYAFEVVFALIAGSSEATIYYGYSPSSPLSWTRVAEAVARAAITQVCVVFFAVAAVEAAARMRSIPGKIVAAFPAWLATLIAALITFWMMRGAALIFRDAALLAPAEQGGMWLPFLGYVSNQSTDIVIVAAIPFFQLGLNVLAPIIAAAPIVETEAERKERMARDEAEAEHKNRMRALNAGGFGAALGGGIKAVKAAYKGDANTVQSSGEGEAQSTGNGGDETPGNETSKGGGTKPRGYGQKAVPSHMMSAKQLRAYLAENEVAISEDKARTMVQSAPGFVQVGTTYYAPRRALMAVANRLIQSANSAANEASDAATLAG